MKPVINPRPGGWEYIFDDVALRLERIREKSDTISAEFTAQYLPLKEEGYLVVGARPNLNSMTAPGLLAKRCHARMNSVPWVDYIETSFALTIRQFRQQTKAVPISQIPPRKGSKWRLEPFLLDNNINLLFGDGGIGKSTMAAFWGLCVEQNYGLPFGIIPTPGNVIYLDYESTGEDIRETVIALQAGLGLGEESQIIYARRKPPLLADIEEISALVQLHDARFIIVDSAVRACGGEKEAKENASPMIDALASLGICVLLISHIPKDTLGIRSKTAYGSVYFWNGPRLIWEMQKQQEVGEDILDVALFNRKSNRTKLHKPVGFRVEFSETQGILISKREIAKMAELSKGLSLRMQIKELLGHGALSKQEIAEHLEALPQTVKVTLSRGKQDGMFQELPGDPPLWGLAIENI